MSARLADSRRLNAVIALFAILAASSARAEEGAVPAVSSGATPAADSASAGGEFSRASNAELQALSARWDDLSDGQRRALLTEFHRRMVAAGRKPVLRIRGERRFGYRVPGPNGQVVEIQRRQGFVRFRELDPSRPFGVGFEERLGADPQPVAVAGQEAPRPGSGAPAGGEAQSAVPPVTNEPVYQLPVRRVRASESPR